jgi:hypothetical protein
MKSAFSLLLLSALIVSAGEPVRQSTPPTPTPHAVTLEERYFETRDAFIRQFEKAPTPLANDDRNALMELEAQIRTIIGPLKTDGFPM